MTDATWLINYTRITVFFKSPSFFFLQIEDLKAIDADIDRLRRQIEEKDKIIIALREAAEAKDKKLENLMVECSKLQSNAITVSRVSSGIYRGE